MGKWSIPSARVVDETHSKLIVKSGNDVRELAVTILIGLTPLIVIFPLAALIVDNVAIAGFVVLVCTQPILKLAFAFRPHTTLFVDEFTRSVLIERRRRLGFGRWPRNQTRVIPASNISQLALEAGSFGGTWRVKIATNGDTIIVSFGRREDDAQRTAEMIAQISGIQIIDDSALEIPDLQTL